MRDRSQLQLAAEAGMIARFQQPRAQLPMDLAGRSDDRLTDRVGRMPDEPHGRSPQAGTWEPLGTNHHDSPARTCFSTLKILERVHPRVSFRATSVNSVSPQ